MTYQPGIPTGTVPLNQDYLNIQDNFTQIEDQFEVDHVPLTSTSGDPPNGYHTNVHLVPNSTTTSNPPNNIPPIQPSTGAGGFGQLWSAQVNDGINLDETLYFLSGGGKNTQLTRNFQPGTNDVGANFRSGATSLPGGFILNFGYIDNAVNGDNIATLRQKFPNNFFCGFATGIRSSSTSNVVYTNAIPAAAPVGGISGITFHNTTSSITKFFWWALGN